MRGDLVFLWLGNIVPSVLRKGMEELFKRNLLRLRQPLAPKTYAEALFGEVNWAKEMTPNTINKIDSKIEFSEKKQVLESLERFAQEKITATPEASIKISGGEIAIRPEPSWEGISQYKDFNQLKTNLSLEEKIIELCLNSKSPESVRIMFVPENFRPYEEIKEELKEGFINQLLPAFPFKTAELFSRMLAAMKLEDKEVIIYPTQMGQKDLSQEVMQVAGFYRPEIIVTLGATPTHKILKGQERLSQVHGEFFNRKIENIGTFIVVPLFHPSIIENNQNMKKTAWSDMQKIMKQLKKL